MKFHCLYDGLVDPKELKPHPQNRNQHPQEQIERLAKVLEYQNWRYAIKISKRSGFITSGHGRVLAAIRKKWKQVPVVYQDYDSAEQEYADVQADNAIASWAELDLAAINLDVPDLGPDFDIDLLGIKDFAIDASDKYADKDADEIPEVKEPICALGDLWSLGSHRLLCGDSTDKVSVERLMNGEKADMVYTDPPYGMNLNTDYSWTKKYGKPFKIARGSDSKGGKAWDPFVGDIEEFDPSHILNLDCEEIFLWGANYYWNKLPNNRTSSLIIWDKKNNVDDSAFGSDFEVCWSKQKHKQSFVRLTWVGLYGTGQEFDNKRSHPTQKPHKLAEIFFERWGKDKSNIVDLNGGSGSTLIACEKQNKKCFMAEMDPHYCDVIIARWEKFTGQKAVKINENNQDQDVSTHGKMAKRAVRKS